MGKSDIAIGGWRTDLSTGPPGVSDIVIVGVGTALLMFVFGVTIMAPPVDAAILGLLYGTVVIAALAGISVLTSVAGWFNRRQ